MAGYVSPYGEVSGMWVRGSFHGHCTENSRCSSVPLADSVRMYHEVGAGFVALTDHDCITDLSVVAEAYPDLVFINGFEYSSRENVVFAGPGVGPFYEQSLEDALSHAGDLLTIVAHPQRQGKLVEYWTLPMLEALGTWPDGTEVYNGHYGIPSAIENGRWPLYDSFWDELLTAGHRVWGYANDDFHDPEDFGNAFNMVLVDEATPESIIRAAKAGRCYATTGLKLAHVCVDGSEIEVKTERVCDGRFVGPGGRILAEGKGRSFTYVASGERYVRFEGVCDAGRIFLQPMFRES